MDTPTTEKELTITAKIKVSKKVIEYLIDTATDDPFFNEAFPKKSDRTFSNEEVVKGIQLALDKHNDNFKLSILQDIQDDTFGCACDCEDAINILQFAKYGEIVYG